MVHESLAAGGTGLSVGRNIFQDDRPDLLVRALHGVVHEDLDVERAMLTLQDAPVA
jgi:class I fructose-bisphosphate aldolase